MAQRNTRSARLQARNRRKYDAMHIRSRTPKDESPSNTKINTVHISKAQPSSTSNSDHRRGQQHKSFERRIVLAERWVAATTRRLLNEMKLREDLQKEVNDSNRLVPKIAAKDAMMKKLKATNSTLLGCLAMAIVASIWDRPGWEWLVRLCY